MKAVLFHIHDDAWLHRWADDFPELSFPVTASLEDLEREIEDAEILPLTNRAASEDAGALLRAKAKSLGWIHFLTAGFDRGVAMGLPDKVRVSYSAGVRAPRVAEHAMALLLGLTRALTLIYRAQSEHRWLREEISERIGTLNEASVCVVGLGHVGRDVARKLKSFGAHVIGVSRAAESDAHVDEIFRREDLHAALARSDALIVCTGADDESKGLIGAAEIAAMKPGAVLVNVARGALVDEAALIEALREGRLGGAGLDVQAIEPLPETSPLWDMANVIVSPHSAGAGGSSYVPHRALFRENLQRFLDGAPHRNQYR